MITATSSKAISDSVISTLSFINTLVTDAANNGFYSVGIEDSRMTQEILDELINNYDYKVDVQRRDGAIYIIDT